MMSVALLAAIGVLVLLVLAALIGAIIFVVIRAQDRHESRD